MRALALLLALGCRVEDPELAARARALEAWRDGSARLEAGDVTGARDRLSSALAERPTDPLLLAWSARAAAADGDLPTALALLDEALAIDPAFAVARYNRAAYAARAGEPEVAARDLARALADGAARPREVLEDPDFAPWLGHEAFGFLPASPLQVALEAPSGTLWWGTEFAVRLRVSGAHDLPLAVTAEAVEGPIALLRVVEETSPSTAGPMRDLVWTWRVAGAGAVRVGPLHIGSGARRATAGEVLLEAAAPAGADEAADAPRDLATPRELAGAHEVPAAWWVGEELRVLVGPDDRVVVSPAPDPPVRYELREAGRTRWRLERFPAAGARAVRVERAGEAVLSVTGP